MKKALAAAAVVLSILGASSGARASVASDGGSKEDVQRVWVWDCDHDGEGDWISGGGLMHVWYGSIRNCDVVYQVG